MHDEVSETENIRKNLAIERMIIEGCEILLDTSQTFVRQGTVFVLTFLPSSLNATPPGPHPGHSSTLRRSRVSCEIQTLAPFPLLPAPKRLVSGSLSVVV